jgi:hypothetical protein
MTGQRAFGKKPKIHGLSVRLPETGLLCRWRRSRADGRQPVACREDQPRDQRFKDRSRRQPAYLARTPDRLARRPAIGFAGSTPSGSSGNVEDGPVAGAANAMSEVAAGALDDPIVSTSGGGLVDSRLPSDSWVPVPVSATDSRPPSADGARLPMSRPPRLRLSAPKNRSPSPREVVRSCRRWSSHPGPPPGSWSGRPDRPIRRGRNQRRGSRCPDPQVGGLRLGIVARVSPHD